MSRHRRSVPSSVGQVIGALASEVQPASLLGDVQRVWPAIAGEALARVATPTAAARGTVTLACQDSLWAHELQLRERDFLEQFATRLGAGVVTKLRCQAVPTRQWAQK
jgi:predicted nucleic acid-binding Zn ribbon protein